MRRLLPALTVLPLIAAASVSAQRWDYPGNASYGWDHGASAWDHPAARPIRDRSHEGKVEVTRFLAEGTEAQALGHGAISVAAAEDGVAGELERAIYEAAVVDHLAGVGYDTAARAGETGQTVELHISHSELQPAEPPHKPVSGEMSVGVDSRGGSYTSLAVGVDMSKPLNALMSTRLEARIRDKATGTVLWEGRADIATREGDPRWTSQKVANKLAGALFSGFPGKNGETIRG